MLNSSRVRVFAPLILIALCFAMPGWAEVPPALENNERTTGLMVSVAVVDEAFMPVAEGFAEWVRLRAGEAGIAVAPGAFARSSDAKTQAQLMALARKQGVRNALLIDLRSRNGMIEVDFRLYELETGTLNGGGLVLAPAGALVYESEAALSIIDQRLGARRTDEEGRGARSGFTSSARVGGGTVGP